VVNGNSGMGTVDNRWVFFLIYLITVFRLRKTVEENGRGLFKLYQNLHEDIKKNTKDPNQDSWSAGQEYNRDFQIAK
jgi:hypothetical protein